MDRVSKVRARQSFHMDEIALYVRTGAKQDGSIQHGVRVEFVPTEPGLYYEPTMVIDLTAAQELMDDLWASGIRPTEGAGTAGSMRATENHLADMRKIAFRALKLDEPLQGS